MPTEEKAFFEEKRNTHTAPEEIITPSYARVRKGLGAVATGNLMHNALFPEIVSTYGGKRSFGPDALVRGVHEAIRSFFDGQMETHGEKLVFNEMLVADAAAQILEVLVPRSEQQQNVLALSQQEMEDNMEELKALPPPGQRAARKKASSKKRSSSLQQNLSAWQAKRQQGDAERPVRQTAPGLKPRKKNREDKRREARKRSD